MHDVRALNELVDKESAFIDTLMNEVGKVIVGQTYMLERILIGLLTGGHVLLEGVPGLAKTLTVRTLCDSISAKFARVQFTPDLLPADLIGTVIYNHQKGEFTSKLGPIFANLVLADEIFTPDSSRYWSVDTYREGVVQPSFDKQPHTRVIKELLTHTFGVPPGSRKVKPFTDHVMGFTLAGNGKIWIRCYQISEQEAAKTVKPGEAADPKALPSISGNKGETNISLVEIGPRLVLTPIVIQEGSFGGPIIYENKEFVSPNQIRSDLRRAKAGRYNERTESTTERKARHRDLGLRTGEGVKNVDPLDNRVVFA